MLFDKPDNATETPETLGGFLRGLGFFCYFLAVICAAMAVWDWIELADIERYGSEWVHEFFRRPMWTMVLLALVFVVNGVGFTRVGAWIKGHTAAERRRSEVPAPPKT